jgi:hypothetical protein
MSDDVKNRYGIDIDELIPRVTEEVAAAMRERAMASLDYQVQAALRTTIEEYITANIVPSVRAELTKNEAEIRAALCAGIVAGCNALAAKLAESATKKIEGYEGDKLLEVVVQTVWGNRRY